MAEVKSLEKRHTVKLDGRKHLEIDGVDSVIAFDEEFVVMSTSMGRLEIEGTEMRIEDLSKGNSKIQIAGTINRISYVAETKKRRLFG